MARAWMSPASGRRSASSSSSGSGRVFEREIGFRRGREEKDEERERDREGGLVDFLMREEWAAENLKFIVHAVKSGYLQMDPSVKSKETRKIFADESQRRETMTLARNSIRHRSSIRLWRPCVNKVPLIPTFLYVSAFQPCLERYYINS